MTRPLKAERYAKGVDPHIVALITDWLPYASYPEAMRFYGEIANSCVYEPQGNLEALLGCNDRFFLLTGLCNRVDMMHPWIYDRCREVEEAPYGYLDLWARGHGKSSLKTFAGTIQEILCDPEVTIGIFSNTRDISRTFLAQIKEEFERNDALKSLYFDVLWQHPRSQAPSWSVERGLTVRRVGNPKEATIEAHGVIDGMPTGRHFRVLRFDDLITEKNVTNPDQIAKATERIQLADNLGIGDGTCKDFTGTRYSFADSYGQMIDEGIVKPRIYPATEDGTLNGKPVLLSPTTWEEKKRAQRSTIAAQMLQNPLAGKENIFKTEWLQPYWVIPQMLNVYILGDPSRGRGSSSDRTALAVVGIDSQGNKYLLDGYCHRMRLSDRWENLRRLHRKWGETPGVQLVKVGYERYGMQSDDEYFDEKMQRSGNYFPIEELNWPNAQGGKSKVHRVERLEPDFREGAFFVPGKVWNPAVEGGVARWALKEGSDEIEYMPYQPHQFERRARANGEFWRIMQPIRRIDQDGGIYDLVRVFFEEYRFFPFSPRDDLVDAMSRIYDMDPMPAVKTETVETEDYRDA